MADGVSKERIDSLREILIPTRTNSIALEKCSLLTLHCIDMDNEFILPLEEISFVEWTARIGHVSTLNELSERRLVLFPNSHSVTELLVNLQSPMVISVSHSFDIQLKPEEEEEEHNPILVIWKFDVVLGIPSKALRPKVQYTGTNSKPQMPYLDLHSVACNCSRWPKHGLILVTGAHNSEAKKHLDDKSDKKEWRSEGQEPDAGDDEESHCDNTAEVSLESDIFKLKGCSYHSGMQKALRVIQGKISKKEELDVKIIEEPVNVQDENALIVKVLINGMYEPVGYVPGKKVQKYRTALQNDEITLVTLKQIHRVYIPAINNFVLFGYVHTIKRGKWLPDNKNYTYNC